MRMHVSKEDLRLNGKDKDSEFSPHLCRGRLEYQFSLAHITLILCAMRYASSISTKCDGLHSTDCWW